MLHQKLVITLVAFALFGTKLAYAEEQKKAVDGAVGYFKSVQNDKKALENFCGWLNSSLKATKGYMTKDTKLMNEGNAEFPKYEALVSPDHKKHWDLQAKLLDFRSPDRRRYIDEKAATESRCTLDPRLK